MIALIIGINSQDGIFLSQYLADLGYEVYGTTRHAVTSIHHKHSTQIKMCTLDPKNTGNVNHLIRTVKPDHIYILAAQSSVSASFADPFGTIQANTMIVLNVLNSVVKFRPQAKVMNASSSEVFGNINEIIDSTTDFQPVSPYALSKANSAQYVRLYSEMFDLYAVNLFLFNHESNYRPPHFVTKKIISYVKSASQGLVDGPLKLGNLDIERDWGLAHEYIVPMVKVLTADAPLDCVICTGQQISLKQFVDHAFKFSNLDARDFVEITPELKRQNEVYSNKGDPNEAIQKLDWSAKTKGLQVIEKLIEYE